MEREREEREQREREEAESREALRLAALERARKADPTRGRLLGVTLRGANGLPGTLFRAGEPVRAEIAYRLGRLLPDPIIGFVSRGRGGVLCCTLHHENDSRCIFRCGYHSCGPEVKR